jgi:hypothetical protein
LPRQGIELLARELEHEIRREPMAIALDSFIKPERWNTVDFGETRSKITRTPRIVRIIPSICSIEIGDLFWQDGRCDTARKFRVTFFQNNYGQRAPSDVLFFELLR